MSIQKKIPMRVINSFIFLLLFSVFSNVSAMQLQLSDVPLPHGARLSLVGNQVAQNGMQLTMAVYESALSIEDTERFYQQIWPDVSGSKIPGMIETRSADWLMLSRLQDGYNIVVQLSLSTPQRSSGYISILPFLKLTESNVNGTVNKEFMRKLSETRSHDGPLASTLSVYESDLPGKSLKQKIVKRRISDRWVLTSDRVFSGSQIVMMSHRSSRMEMVITPSSSGGSILVLNEVENGD